MNLTVYWDKNEGKITHTKPPGWERHIPIAMGHFIFPHMVAYGVHDFEPLAVTVIDVVAKQESMTTRAYPLNPVEVRKAEERKAEEQAKDGGGG